MIGLTAKRAALFDSERDSQQGLCDPQLFNLPLDPHFPQHLVDLLGLRACGAEHLLDNCVDVRVHLDDAVYEAGHDLLTAQLWTKGRI